MIHEQWTQIIDMMIHYNIIRMGFFRSLFTRIRIGTSTLEHDSLSSGIGHIQNYEATIWPLNWNVINHEYGHKIISKIDPSIIPKTSLSHSDYLS